MCRAYQGGYWLRRGGPEITGFWKEQNHVKITFKHVYLRLGKYSHSKLSYLSMYFHLARPLYFSFSMFFIFPNFFFFHLFCLRIFFDLFIHLFPFPLFSSYYFPPWPSLSFFSGQLCIFPLTPLQNGLPERFLSRFDSHTHLANILFNERKFFFFVIDYILFVFVSPQPL